MPHGLILQLDKSVAFSFFSLNSLQFYVNRFVSRKGIEYSIIKDLKSSKLTRTGFQHKITQITCTIHYYNLYTHITRLSCTPTDTRVQVCVSKKQTNKQKTKQNKKKQWKCTVLLKTCKYLKIQGILKLQMINTLTLTVPNLLTLHSHWTVGQVTLGTTYAIHKFTYYFGCSEEQSMTVLCKQKFPELLYMGKIQDANTGLKINSSFWKFSD